MPGSYYRLAQTFSQGCFHFRVAPGGGHVARTEGLVFCNFYGGDRRRREGLVERKLIKMTNNEE